MFNLNAKILIVDDLPEVVDSLVEVCKQIGFTNLTEAQDGNDAWEAILAANPPFDLILSDWTMPGLSGLELLKRVRADERFSKIPFLMITGQGETSQIIDALKSGATNYLVKPFSLPSLKEKLQVMQTGYTDSNPVRKS